MRSFALCVPVLCLALAVACVPQQYAPFPEHEDPNNDIPTPGPGDPPATQPPPGTTPGQNPTPPGPPPPTPHPQPPPAPTGLAVLGSGSGDCSADLEIVATSADGLDNPTDFEMNPEVPGEGWVVNKDDDSVSILSDFATGSQTSEHIVDPYALHFMEKVTSISFGAPGTFGTCQDGRNTYNGQGSANDFTGPTLWSSDPDVFGISNPEAVDYLSGLFGGSTDLGSHLDMLHESPECMGIEWETGNVYWVYDGFHGSINRYDFEEDHGPGYDNHCDGDIQRWTGLGLDRVAGVVSHLALDHGTGLLYVADTGNGRILAVDTNSGQSGNSLYSSEESGCNQLYAAPGPAHYTWTGATVTTVVSGLDEPAGIALLNGILYVTEHGTGVIHAFSLDGATLDAAATGRPNALQGITALSSSELVIVDGNANQLLRLTAP